MKSEETTFTNPFDVLHQVNMRLSNIEKRLEESNTAQSEKEPKSKYLSMDEFRELHPAHPAKQTVYNWTHSKIVPFRKSGKKIIFLRSEIEKFIEETCK